MLAFAGLKGLTLDRRNLTKRWVSWGKEPQQDSDLPDEVIMEIARTDGERAYAMAKNPENTVVVQCRIYPNVGFVRGTDSGKDWKSDILQGMGYKDANFVRYVREVNEFLFDHPQVDTLIGHSLGFGVVLNAVEDKPHIRIVGLDGAMILGPDNVTSTKSRNINTDGQFDRFLGFGPNEMSHNPRKYFDSSLDASDRVGHQAWNAPYQKKFRGIVDKQHIKRTGYYSGRISYQSSHVGGAMDRVDVGKVGIF
jgi:hypothetical protein